MSLQKRAFRSRAKGLASSVTEYLSLAACKNGVAITRSPNCQSWTTNSFGFTADEADYGANWLIVKLGGCHRANKGLYHQYHHYPPHPGPLPRRGGEGRGGGAWCSRQAYCRGIRQTMPVVC